MTYPPTIADLRSRLADYPAYAGATDARLSLALDSARAELESAVPNLGQVALDEGQARQAAMLCLDLAAYHLKRAVERTEEGDIPMALWRERQDLNRRIQQLMAALDSGIYIAPLERLDPPELPK